MEKHLPYLLSAALILLLWFVAHSVGGFLRPEKPERAPWARHETSPDADRGPIHLGFRSLLAITVIVLPGLLLALPLLVVFLGFAREGNGWALFLESFLFLAMIAVALAHAWKRGDLRWVGGAEERAKEGAGEGFREGPHGDS